MEQDLQQISQLFQATLEPDEQMRSEAEKRLKVISTNTGFLPTLLRLVMLEDVPVQIRQAGVIYFKNIIGQHWRERDPELVRAEDMKIIDENDKQFIRSSIVESIIQATELIRVQLTVSVQEILSSDFPEKWPDICDKLSGYLTSENRETWLGSMLVLYQIIKKYEFKREAEREPIINIMEVFLPLLQNRCTSLVKDDSPQASTLIAKIFKIFRGLIQLHLPLKIINQNNFPQWFGLFRTVLEKPIPEAANEADEDDRPQLPWWKAKKWAITILCKMFDRYGCPGSEEKIYQQFADFYDKKFSEMATKIMLQLLDQHRRKEYVTPRIIHHALSYLTQGVYNARSWKIVKPHVMQMVKEIIFPLMCHSDEDEALWEEDPQEYIRSKYDLFEDFLLFSPSEAAKAYLTRVAVKRKDVLKPVVDFISEVFVMDQNAPGWTPKLKDGALHMVGSLAEGLAKKKNYKNQMESVLMQFVFPEFQSQSGFLRARACWVVQQFSVIEFKNPQILTQTIHSTMQCLTDKDLPVQVEAGIAIRHIIDNQSEKATEIIRPHVKDLVQHLLKILAESENDELTGTISKLVEDFSEEVSQIALELVQTLCHTFMSLVQSEEDYDNKSVTAMGILETIQTVMGELEEAGPIISQLEQVVSDLIVTVLSKELMEFYEEVFSLINECTVVQVSDVMWKMLFLLHDTFHKDTSDYFTEMMPCLHNYVTVDPQAFLSNSRHCEVMFNMCKKMLMEYTGEGAQTQAAKLLEVIVLQYRGELNQWIPVFVQLVVERLSKELLTSELRVMLLQVIIAAFINNPILVFECLSKMEIPSAPQGMIAQVLSAWLKDTDCFLGLHDRKVYIFGMCTLMLLPPDHRPAELNAAAGELLPSMIVVFNGLNSIYEKINKEDDDEDAEVEEDEDGDELADSDDEYDEDGLKYQEGLDKINKVNYGEIEDDDWENDLDVFTTPIDDNPDMDEYIHFKKTFEVLQSSDPQLFAVMTQALNEEQKQMIQQLIDEGIRKEKMHESRQIEGMGGYQFNVTSIPQNFAFGS